MTGLAINWQCFGSNGQVKADYSRGVLERFTRRAPNNLDVNKHIKTIANPRKINFIGNPHFAVYFEGGYTLDEVGKVVNGPFNEPVTAEKIVVNHYHCKSWEEYQIKNRRGYAPVLITEEHYTKELFDDLDGNEVFDDGILKYRAARAESFSLEFDAEKFERLEKALLETLKKYATGEMIENKLETALTCRALSTYLREKFPSNINYWQNFEKASLAAILQSLENYTSIAEMRLLIAELPNLLTLPYYEVQKLRGACLNIIPQMMNFMLYYNNWFYYVELDYIYRLLKNFRE